MTMVELRRSAGAKSSTTTTAVRKKELMATSPATPKQDKEKPADQGGKNQQSSHVAAGAAAAAVESPSYKLALKSLFSYRNSHAAQHQHNQRAAPPQPTPAPADDAARGARRSPRSRRSSAAPPPSASSVTPAKSRCVGQGKCNFYPNQKREMMERLRRLRRGGREDWLRRSVLVAGADRRHTNLSCAPIATPTRHGALLARKHGSAKFLSSPHGGPAAFFAPFLGSPRRRGPPGMEEAVRAASPFAWLLRWDAGGKRRSDACHSFVPAAWTPTASGGAADRRRGDPAVEDPAVEDPVVEDGVDKVSWVCLAAAVGRRRQEAQRRLPFLCSCGVDADGKRRRGGSPERGSRGGGSRGGGRGG